MVHRDFKPWNIRNQEKTLIFDFEETILNGPPLEDIFNFFIDPKIRYKTPKQVYDLTGSIEKEIFELYLRELGVKINFRFFITDLYVLERIVFWSNAEIEITSSLSESLELHIKRIK